MILQSPWNQPTSFTFFLIGIWAERNHLWTNADNLFERFSVGLFLSLHTIPIFLPHGFGKEKKCHQESRIKPGSHNLLNKISSINSMVCVHATYYWSKRNIIPTKIVLDPWKSNRPSCQQECCACLKSMSKPNLIRPSRKRSSFVKWLK